jgi:type IV pilus assembly protein PilX
MNKQTMRSPGLERGMVLISALLLLLVMTILGIAMFRTFGMQERIAGNTREKQRALHAADTAEAYAEWWLTTANGAHATTGNLCSSLLDANADPNTVLVCSNQLTAVVADPAVVPWMSGANEVGASYAPPGLAATTGLPDSYFLVPRFYISFVSGFYNSVSGAQTNSYLIDATGYGGTANAVSVAETAYVVSTMFTTQSKKTKFVNMGGP